jgi:DNA-directed RNA polymerase subunit RPC12/RpoP
LNKQDKKKQPIIKNIQKKECRSTINGYQTFKCPRCKEIMTIDKYPEKRIIIECPHCHQKASIVPRNKQKNELIYGAISPIENSIDLNLFEKEEQQKRKVFKQTFLNSLKQPYLRARLFGLILVIIGSVFYLFPMSSLITKIGVSFILMGIISFMFITEEKILLINNSLKKEKKHRMQNINLLFSEKLVLVLNILILFIFLITDTSSLELFFILIYLGLIIIKELTKDFTPIYLERKLNMFVIGFFIIFIIIIIKRVMAISGL